MTNRELFLAISDVVKRETQSVKTELRTELGEEINKVRTELGEELDKVRTEQGEELDKVRTELNGKIDSVKSDVKSINLKLENDIEPKIQILVENYVPAAQKYAENTEHTEALRSDIDLVKAAVEEHSKQLKKLYLRAQ